MFSGGFSPRLSSSTQTTEQEPRSMGDVIADMSMSLDGFIADKDGRIDALVGWFFSGDAEVPTANPGLSFRTSEPSAEVLRNALESVGAIVGGRDYFDAANGWGGTHPMGVPTFIVTHRPPPDDWPADNDDIRFVNDGVKSAIEQAKAVAGHKAVALATPTVTRAAHAAGLLDVLSVNLVPVVLGEGIPWFAGIADAPLALEGPTIVAGTGVTHLTYRVVRAG
jgi:dihydrofolate reductase